MAHSCSKQGCELEVKFVCQCVCSKSYCCELHLGMHLQLPNRAHAFDCISEEPCEWTKTGIIDFLIKEKLKKKKLKKIVLTVLPQNYNNLNRLKELDSDLKEIKSLIEKFSQISEEDSLLNELILEPDADTERAKAYDSELSSSLEAFCKLGQLRNKRYELLNRVNNDPKTEQDFRNTCLLNQNYASDILLRQACQEYNEAYQKIASLYLIENYKDKVNLFIHNTENEREELKILENKEKFNAHPKCIVQLPNEEIFFIDCNHSGNAYIIDRNYQIRKLPLGMPKKCFPALYFNRNIYFFGQKLLNSSCRFDLDENRWKWLAQMQQASAKNCNSLIFNENILISKLNFCNILLYSIDIDSFSTIPYEFGIGHKILLKAKERLYLIECFMRGRIYESEVGDEYVWTKIAHSKLEVEFEQMNFSYNKNGIYISILYSNHYRGYFKFDLDQKVLIEIACYSEHLVLKKQDNKIEPIDCYCQNFELDPDHAAAYIEKGYSLWYIAQNIEKILSYNEAIKRNPKNAANYARKADILEELDYNIEALEFYNTAIMLEPKNTCYYLKKGWTLKYLNRILEEIECYNEIIKLDPQNEDSYIRKAEALHEIKSYLEEIELYNKVIMLNPKCVYAYINKAHALDHVGRSLGKIECYDEGIKNNPEYLDLYFYKGATLRDLGLNSEALELYNEIIRLGSEVQKAYIKKAKILCEMSRNSEAIDCYNEAIKLEPKNNCAYKKKADLLHSMGNDLEAIECYNDFIKICPKDTKFYIKKADFLHIIGKNLEAIDCYSEIIKFAPRVKHSYIEKAEILHDMDRNLEAIECLNNIIKINPKNEQLYIKKAKFLHEMSRSLEEIECYNEIIKLEPKDEYAYMKKADLLHDMGRNHEEIECYTDWMKIKPKDAQLYMKKANLLYNLGWNLEAIDCYNEAINLTPNDSNAFLRKGLIFNSLGRNLEAIECFNEVIKLCPENANAYLIKACILHDMSRDLEEIDCYNDLIKLKPEDISLYSKKANAFHNIGRNLDAFECYSEIIRIDPRKIYTCINLSDMLQSIWKNLKEIIDNYKEKLFNGLNGRDFIFIYYHLNLLFDLYLDAGAIYELDTYQFIILDLSICFNINREFALEYLELLKIVYTLLEFTEKTKEKLYKIKEVNLTISEKIRATDKKEPKVKDQSVKFLNILSECLNIFASRPFKARQQMQKEAAEFLNIIIETLTHLWVLLSLQ